MGVRIIITYTGLNIFHYSVIFVTEVFWNSKLSEQFFKIPSYQDFFYKSNPKCKLFQSKKIFFGKYKLFHYFHKIIIRPSSLKGLHYTEQKFCNFKECVWKSRFHVGNFIVLTSHNELMNLIAPCEFSILCVLCSILVKRI